MLFLVTQKYGRFPPSVKSLCLCAYLLQVSHRIKVDMLQQVFPGEYSLKTQTIKYYSNLWDRILIHVKITVQNPPNITQIIQGLQCFILPVSLAQLWYQRRTIFPPCYISLLTSTLPMWARHRPTFVWGPRQQSFGSWTGKPAATEAADGDAGWCWEACSVHTNMGWAAGHPTGVPHKQIPRTPWLV